MRADSVVWQNPKTGAETEHAENDIKKQADPEAGITGAESAEEQALKTWGEIASLTHLFD